MCNLGDSASRIIRWVLCGSAVVAFCLSAASVASCRFLEFKASDEAKHKQGLGAFAYEYDHDDDGRCLAYPHDTEYDSADKAGRAFGVMAPVFGGLTMLGLVSSMCFLKNRPKATPALWLVWRIGLILSLVFQLLTFTLFATDACTDKETYGKESKCLPGAGSILSIVAVLFWLACVVLSWLVPAPGGPLFLVSVAPKQQKEMQQSQKSAPGDEAGDVGDVSYVEPKTEKASAKKTVTVENGPHGSKTITEVTNADGSITTTIEESV